MWYVVDRSRPTPTSFPSTPNISQQRFVTWHVGIGPQNIISRAPVPKHLVNNSASTALLSTPIPQSPLQRYRVLAGVVLYKRLLPVGCQDMAAVVYDGRHTKGQRQALISISVSPLLPLWLHNTLAACYSCAASDHMYRCYSSVCVCKSQGEKERNVPPFTFLYTV